MTNQERETTKCPELWPSIARLLATAAIFTFHCLGLFRRPSYHLDYFAILLFSFLSGYLCAGVRRNRAYWATKRYFGIMVPYWIVIVPAIIFTITFKHKEVTTIKVLCATLGLNLFINDPIYVISWYITFVLILYSYAFLNSFFGKYGQALLALAGLALFEFVLRSSGYFAAFLAGLFLSNRSAGATLPRSPRMARVSGFLFALQQYCYPFYLVHGGIAYAFIRKTNLHPAIMVAGALFATCACSVFLHFISQPLIDRIVGARLFRRPAAVHD